MKVVLVLSGVLALNSADTASIGALGPLLERRLGISHTQLGLFTSVSAGIGLLATPVAGVLADRANRVRLLVFAICGWSASLVVAAFSTGYLMLLLSRLALGAAVAAAGPLIASLIGDLFPTPQRARVYGWVLSGEAVGAGLGLLIGGSLGVAISWRAAFFLFAAGSGVLALVLHRVLPEPRRGGADRIAVRPASGEAGKDQEDLVVKAVNRRGVEPVPDRVVSRSEQLSYWQAAVLVLRIPSVRSIIVASAVGYFFFAGLRAFAIVLAVRHYNLPAGLIVVIALAVGATGLAGTLLGGRLADRQLARGRLTARVDLPPWGYIGSAIAFLPALLLTDGWVVLPLVLVGAALLSATNPPLDAARLDIVPGNLWGRAESVRTVIRLVAETAAPALFGLTADKLSTSAHPGVGIRDAFVVMLLPLALNGVLLLRTRRSYPADVATAAASDADRK